MCESAHVPSISARGATTWAKLCAEKAMMTSSPTWLPGLSPWIISLYDLNGMVAIEIRFIRWPKLIRSTDELKVSFSATSITNYVDLSHPSFLPCAQISLTIKKKSKEPYESISSWWQYDNMNLNKGLETTMACSANPEVLALTQMRVPRTFIYAGDTLGTSK